jgi:thiamine-phosphate pyrophosphorylase
MLHPTKTPLVYLITDGKATSNNFKKDSERILNLVSAAVSSGVSLIQIREKKLVAREVFELTLRAAKITKNTATLLLVNDRADLAFAAEADGVHLTAKSLPARIIRRSFPANFTIGVSTHSSGEVLTAGEHGADFAVFSPIFYSPNKGEALGTEKLREICSMAPGFPIIALGGIDETNFQSALRAGAKGIAAIRFLNDADKLPQIMDKIKNAQKS